MQLKWVQWDFEAWEEYLYWQTQDKRCYIVSLDIKKM